MTAGCHATPPRLDAQGRDEPVASLRLEIYGAPPEVVREMVQLAKDKDKSGIVRHYRDLISKTLAEYLVLESDASELSVLQSELVDGLLQTEDYARAIISVFATNPSEPEVDRLVELRMARQRRLTGDNPPELVVVLGETALHNQVGGTKVLKAQLEHLLALGKLPNVTIQVLPFTAGAHPASGTNFILLGFPDQADPDVVFTENLVGFSILEDAEDVRPLNWPSAAFWERRSAHASPRSSSPARWPSCPRPDARRCGMPTPHLSRVPAEWRTSSYTQGNGACVEVARGELAVGMRDSKYRTGPALLLEPAAFTALLGSIIRG